MEYSSDFIDFGDLCGDALIDFVFDGILFGHVIEYLFFELVAQGTLFHVLHELVDVEGIDCGGEVFDDVWMFGCLVYFMLIYDRLELLWVEF